MSYTIGIHGCDTSFKVNYDPSDDTVELVACDIVATQDMDNIFVAVPVGKLGVKMTPLREYLTTKARMVWNEDDMAQEDYRLGQAEAAAEFRRG